MLKKKLLTLTILFVTLLAISAVSAADNVTGLDSLDNEVVNVEISDSEIMSEKGSGAGTFEDLSGEINKIADAGTLTLTKDYKYVNGSTEGIVINKSITIDGQGHTIDGNAQSRIFNTVGNVTLKNIKLINAFAQKGGAILADASITCDNVIFENNTAKTFGGAIYTGILHLNNCTFDANNAENGAALYITKKAGEIDIPESMVNRSVFMNMDSSSVFVYDMPCPVNVRNSAFENITSQMGAAIVMKICNGLNVNNTSFKNLNARNGAAIHLYATPINVQNSNFINCNSSNNGGAILLDLYAEHNFIEPIGGSSQLENCNFTDCSAKFGGVITVTGGKLTVFGSNFENNFASSKGGAIYTSIANELIVANSTFKNNKANYSFGKDSSNGGAIYTLFNPVSISNSNFTGNSANAIYSNGCNFTLTNSQFKDNGEAIHIYYPKSLNLTNNTFNNDKAIENDVKDYHIIVSNAPIQLPNVNNTIDVKNLPSRFDLRDWGWSTKVKDQNGTSGCWAFTAITAFESNIRMATGLEYNASTRNMHRVMTAFSEYGNNRFPDGVNDTGTPIDYLVSWLGPIPEQYDSLDNFAKIDDLIFLNESIHIQDVMLIRGYNYGLTRDEIKMILMQYGAIATAYSWNTRAPDYNISSFAEYSTEIGNGNHAMTLIGWDDNYSKNNFYTTPPGDGAWIYQNSYGVNNGLDDKGYVYISYYDKEVFWVDNSYVILFENRENYTRNYQTDLGGELGLLNSTSQYSYKNSYKSIGDELISGVGTYFNDKNQPYTLEIYVNGDLKLMQSGLAPFYGYHTIKLNRDIAIRAGDNFTALIKTHSVPIIMNSSMQFKKNVSFVDMGSGWKDMALENSTVTLKVYTKSLVNLTPDVKVPNVTEVYNGGKYLTVTVRDVYGEALNGVKVTVKLSNGLSKTFTVKNGQVKMLLNNLAPKTYTATVNVDEFGNYTASSVSAKVVVKKATPKLSAKAKAFKKSLKTKKYTITLKTNRNKVMKNTKVYLKLNGKTYAAKTNSKGKATFKITKLAKKGKFTATVTYKGNSYYNKVAKKVKITLK